ncbi:MAG: hypothetical protein IFK94_15875, partial [Acidobacteria bacterium]|nr:hypothetical protein [Candidatus Polarisedimenticola svalbardensis]
MNGTVHVAESVLPGHPDRLADAMAEKIVDAAVRIRPDSLVGVEVAVHRKSVYVTGRIGIAGPPLNERPDLLKLAYEAYDEAGYKGFWQITPEIRHDLDWKPVLGDERKIRCISDDQNIVVGHASGSAATGWLPAAAFAARKMRDALGRIRRRNFVKLGPDGKVLVRFVEQEGRYYWQSCNVAVMHAEGMQFEELYRIVLPGLKETARELDQALPGLAESWAIDKVRLNGAGDFSCGGPHGDNGLSGKKLVV